MEWVFLGMLVLAWLISPIVLFIALVVARRRLRELRRLPPDRRSPQGWDETASAQPAPMLGGNHRYAPADLENLALLQLELQRLRKSGILEETRFQQLADLLDRRWAQHLREGGAQPDNGVWRQRRAVAWNLLTQDGDAPLGPPPWQRVAPPPSAATDAFEISPAQPRLVLKKQETVLEHPVAPPSLPRASAPDAERILPIPPTPTEEDIAGAAEDWRPAAPNPLEKALQALSGWPKLIAPFLAQNIGWFIGGFCFTAGALFLIANTDGFINALVVFASLTGATAFLLWAGYQFRRNRPELVVTGSMLLTLAMLLAPLDLAATVRLASAADGSLFLLLISLSVGAATAAAFAWAAFLACGLMDRALMGRYPWLLTALATVQLAAPLATVIPDWRGLAALHGIVLGLLGYALRTFITTWLQRLFVDRRMTTYYAAGLLVYAALTSFVHLTWLWPEPLPKGYTGPFLMVLCGLLFPVDAAFKEWGNRHVFLSRFSFALYGLSAAAITIAAQTMPTALVTLALGALLYGWVTWRYRTLPPLYLFFACMAGLYGLTVLNALPPAWRGLAALPGLAALLSLGRWAHSRSRAVALQCLITCGALLIGLVAWNATWNTPGWISLATAAAAALMSYAAVRLALALPEANPRWAYGDGAVAAFAAAAVFSAPSGPPFDWVMQAAFALLVPAALWIALGLHNRRLSSVSRTVFITAGLLNIAAAAILGGIAFWIMTPGPWALILLAALIGALLLWLSLSLRRQALFYGVLACAGVVGVLIKQTYFPGPGSGLSQFIAVSALWILLWRMEQWSRLRAALLANTDSDNEPTRLSDVIRAPLEQAMVLLWLLGLALLSLRLLEGYPIGLPTTVTAALSGLLLIGYFHRFRWVALPMLLGLAGLLAGLQRIGLTLPWLGAAAVLYALLIWRCSIALLAKPVIQRLAYAMGFTTPDGVGGARHVEQSLHGCALLIATATVAAGSTLALLGTPMPTVGPALVSSLLLFGWSGHYDRSGPHAYAALITLMIIAWPIGLWLSPDMLPGLGQPLLNISLSLGMASAAVALEAERVALLAYWCAPLYRIGGLLYLAALTTTTLVLQTAAPHLPIVWALLCIALFPVTRPLANGAAWRGLGLALLPVGLIGSLSAIQFSFYRDAAGIAFIWGYVLWLGGNLLLPRWNARWPDWAVSATLWPLLGLLSVSAGAAISVMSDRFSIAAAEFGWSLYLFLLLRNTAWSGVAWAAAAALTASGLSVAMGGHLLPNSRSAWIAALVWLNVLFLLIPLWRRYGALWAHRLGWRRSELESPLFWIPFIVLILLLAQLLMREFALLWTTTATSSALLTGAALLASATALHAYRIRPSRTSAHVVLSALGATMIAVLLDSATSPMGLPAAVAVWNGALLSAWRYRLRRSALWDAALQPWLTLLPVAGIALLFIAPTFHWTIIAITLSATAAVVAVQGVWQRRPSRLKVGFFLALIAGYSVWLVGVAGFAWTPVVGIAPWCAMQTVVLTIALIVLQRWLTLRIGTVDSETDADRFNRLCEIEAVIAGWIPTLLLFSGVWLALHGYAAFAHQAGWDAPPWRFGMIADASAAGATLLMLTGLAAVRAWRRPDQPSRIYAAALLLGLSASYGRLIALGLTPFTVGDTVVLMAAGYIAFLLHQFTGVKALYRLALLLPVSALATAPLQLASPWTGGTLLAAAVLYLSLAGALRNPLPLYLGVSALNGAVYLWAPLWMKQYGLWQLVIVPAAVSVLALLHLHRRELRPKVLNGARLAALSALYAGAGLDVFLRPELIIFVLALGLAFGGMIVGVALRIRAFLYAGVAFLVMNVAGQLFRFYPDQGLSRALILLGLGTVITLGMVVFNLKREAILQRIRLVRADLAAWE